MANANWMLGEPLNSLGLRTELFIHGFDGVIKEREDYIVVESPANPTYYWGNLLVFRTAPRPGDSKKWIALFEKEFAHQPRVRHRTFTWDEPFPGAAEEFVRDWFRLEETIVLSTQSVNPPPKVHPHVDVRPIVSDDDWEQAFLNQMSCRGDDFTWEEHAPFKRAQMARYRAMHDAGMGHWFGAFLDGRIVADLGIFVSDGVGRFQSVGTHPDFRRQGLCGTLVWRAAEFAFKSLGARHLVMMADENYHAAKIYESVGFLRHEKTYGVCRRPRNP